MQANRVHKLLDVLPSRIAVLTVHAGQRKFAVTNPIVVGKIDGSRAHDRKRTGCGLDGSRFIDVGKR